MSKKNRAIFKLGDYSVAIENLILALQVKGYNLSFLPKQKWNEYISSVSKKLLQQAIKKDCSIGYKGVIPGFRFEKAPLERHLQYMKKHGKKPPNTVLAVMITVYEDIKKYGGISSRLAKKFDVKIPAQYSDLVIQNTCTLDTFEEIKQQEDCADLVILMSICGIIITDEELEEIIVEPPEEVEKHLIISVGQYIKYVKDFLNNCVDTNREISDLSKSVKSMVKLFQGSISREGLGKTFDKIKRLESLKIKLQSINERTLQISDKIIKKNQENDTFDDILYSNISIDLSNILTIEKLNTLLLSIEKYYKQLDNLTITIDEINDYRKCSNELKIAVEKVSNEIEQRLKELKSLSRKIIAYKKQIELYLENNNLLGKPKLKYSISLEFEIENIQDMEYPSEFNNAFTSVKEQVKKTENYLRKKLIPFEKERILSEFEKLGTAKKEVNKAKKDINRASLEDILQVFKDLNEKIDERRDRQPTEKSVKFSKRQESIINTADKVIKSLMLLKYFNNKKTINDEDLFFFNTSVQDISLSNSENIYLLTELAKTVNAKLDYKKKAEFSEERGKYLAILARIISVSQNYDLYEFFETGLAIIPFDEHKNQKKILRLVSEGKEFEVGGLIEPKELSSNRAHDYFIKESNHYTHPITRDKRYSEEIQEDLQRFFYYLESNFYKHILTKRLSAVELKSLRLKLGQLNEEVCWDGAGTEHNFSKFPTYRKGKLATDFRNISDSLIDIIDARIKSIGQKEKSNIFLKEDVSMLTMEVIKFTKKAPIFKQDSEGITDDVNVLSNVIQYMMKRKAVYLSQPDLILFLYFSDPKDLDTLTEKIKILPVVDEEKQSETCLELVTKHQVQNAKILSYTREGLGKQYERFRNEYIELKRELSGYTTVIHKHYSEKYQDAVDSERFGFAGQLYNESERKQKDEKQREENRIQTQFDELSDRADYLQQWIREYPRGKESDVLTEVFARINSILLKKDTSRLNESEVLIQILEESCETKSVDISYLKDWLTDYESEKAGTADLSTGDKISIRDLQLMLKERMAPPDGLVKRVEQLRERKQVQVFIDCYLRLRSEVVTTADPISRADFEIAQELLRSAAKCFRCYSDPETEKCQELGGIGTLPFLVTDSYTRLPMGRKIVLTAIAHKGKKFLGKSYIKDIGAILQKELEKTKAGNPEDYFIVCFVCGNAERLKENVRLEEFDNLLILDDIRSAEVITKESLPAVSLKHYLIRGFPLLAVNPFNSERYVTGQTGVFVERGILTNVTKDNESYAIYGARRIGKTSICKHIEETSRNKSNYICKYFSKAAYKCKSTEFDDVFSIGLDILDSLGVDTGSINTIATFSKAFSKYLVKQKKGNYNVWIIIDEFDQYVNEVDKAYLKNNETNDYPFITVLRDLKNQHNNFKLVISGFMTLYYKLNDEIPGLAKSKNPWVGFFNQLPINVLTQEEAKALIYKLDEELDLEFENKELPHYILRKTSRQPAYIQYFLRRLVNRISQRVTQEDRVITKKDVDDVFDEYLKGFAEDERSFIKYVDDMLRLNTDPISRVIIAIMALEESEIYKKESLRKTFLETLELKSIEPKRFERCITNLKVTQVINVKLGEIEFKYLFWKEYLHQLLLTNNEDEWDNIIKEAKDDLNKNP
jgi:hypothetical protein